MFNFGDKTVDRVRLVKQDGTVICDDLDKVVFSSPKVSDAVVFEKNKFILVAGTSKGLWYSQDLGEHWYQSNITSGHFGNENNKSDDFGYGNIVYSSRFKKFFAHAQQGTGSYLYMSKDGKTWETLIPKGESTKKWTDLRVDADGYVYCSGSNSRVRTGHVFYYDSESNTMISTGSAGYNSIHYIVKNKVSGECYIYDYDGCFYKLNANKSSIFVEGSVIAVYDYASYEVSYLTDDVFVTHANDYVYEEGYDNYACFVYSMTEKKEFSTILEDWNNSWKEYYENGLYLITDGTYIWYSNNPIHGGNFSKTPYVKNTLSKIGSYKTNADIIHYLIKKGNYIYDTTAINGTWTQVLNDSYVKLPTDVKLPTEVNYKNTRYLLYPSSNKLYVKDLTNDTALKTVTTTFGTGFQIVANQ